MSLTPFTEEYNKSSIPLPEEILKILTDHSERMIQASDRDHHEKPFLSFLNDFDWEKDRKQQWLPEYLAPLYGTAFYNTLNDEQKLVLNHMGWVAHYQYSTIGEVMTLKYNNHCADIFSAHGYDTIARYMRRESEEEITHITTFSRIGEVVERYYTGDAIIRKRIGNAYDLPDTGFQDFAPWKATSFYYWLRGHQNVALRVREQDMQRTDSPATAVKITTAHFRDETRHYATSHLLAQTMSEIDESLPNPVRLDYVCKLSFQGGQAGANWIWPSVSVVPGTLINETAKLLMNPVFKLTRAQVLDVIEDVYTRRPPNAKWEGMRSRAMRPTMNLNHKAKAWIPERFLDEDKIGNTMKFNPDMGVAYARKAFNDFKKSWENPSN